MVERDFKQRIEAVYQSESRAVLATLIRLLGDFDRAEEALHDAFRAALEKWPEQGLPENPRAWLVSAGRFRSIDQLRRQTRFDSFDPQSHDIAGENIPAPDDDDPSVADDQLRLIFTCCHPALAPDAQIGLTLREVCGLTTEQIAQIGLTLREVCGLTTEQIAQAFLTPVPTLAQRIVRAKGKIRDARIPYEVPAPAELAERLETVLRVIYLVFNEGYTASSGSELMRLDLASEAIRLGRLLVEMLPETEAMGLLALMLLQDSRRAARASPAGELIILEEQDRSLWNRAQIQEGAAMVERALSSRRFGPYSLQAAIAAVHCEAPRAADTDWNEIVYLYEVLLRIEHTPVIELNRAVAVAMRDGPAAGLALVDDLLARGDLAGYRLAHAARADLCRRLGRNGDARAAYTQALALTQSEPERQFLQRRLAELGGD